jgi:hypothetical protein
MMLLQELNNIEGAPSLLRLPGGEGAALFITELINLKVAPQHNFITIFWTPETSSMGFASATGSN